MLYRGAIGGKTGKTGKTAVLPWFCKIERSGGSGGHVIVVLASLGARAAPVAPLIVMRVIVSNVVEFPGASSSRLISIHSELNGAI